MGKKKGSRNSECGSQNPISLREEATGKIQTKTSTTTKSTFRIEHLKNLAIWSTTDPLIPSLGAFYGHNLASLQEAAGVPPDPSLITCQRCESVLHPGFNATVRIEKNRSKVRHKRKKSGNITQNHVVYKCHFCLHENLKRGTPKGHLKGLYPSRVKSLLASTPPSKPIIRDNSRLEKGIVSKDEADQTDLSASRIVAKDVALMDNLATPPLPSSSRTSLLEGKKRKANSLTSKKANETASLSAKVEAANTQSTTVSKRRKKSWTSLKKIAQSNENDKSGVANLTIPFFL